MNYKSDYVKNINIIIRIGIHDNRRFSCFLGGIVSELIRRIYNKILEADKVLEGIIHRTPLDKSRTFSQMVKGEVYLKLENLQKTGSFKVRGAYYKIHKLSDDDKKRGVVAASAGNHAQGVAYAASMAGVHAKIVMPIFAPIAKILATRSYNAEVVLHGTTFDESLAKALEISQIEKRTFIHAFDDEDVIAGQGTIGLEILRALPNPDIVVVPIGGGGLISGISIAIKKKLGDNVKIIGVQTEAFPGALEAVKGVEAKVKPWATIADGIAVKKPGRITTEIIKELVDDIITVNDDEISRAIFLLLERGKTLAEGAGAVSLAGLLSGKIDAKGKKVVCVISGGNIDFTLLTKIISRELVRMQRLVRIRAVMPDRPGALSRILSILAEARINIVDIFSEKYDVRNPPYEASMEIVMEVTEEQKLLNLLDKLRREGYEFEILKS